MAATVTKIDYLTKAAEAVKRVYSKIVSLGCIHASGATTYDQMVSLKKVTCASAASIAYQIAGILPSGKVVSHTKAVGGSDANIRKKKPTVAKAMTGVANLPKDKVDVVWIGKKYADLPAKYRKAGVMYIQDSNVCICAGGGAIYSCNGAKGSQLNSKGRYIKNKITSGYAFTSPILVAIIPKEVPMTLNVIDVSQFNPSINWASAAKAVDGVIIRAGYRGTGGGLKTDPLFLQHIRGAIGAGVNRIGIYWWTTHCTSAQAQEDAAYLIKLLAPYKGKVNFGVWLDSESPGSAGSGANGKAFMALSAAARTTCHLAFLAAVKAVGYQVGVYASDSWYGTHLVMSKLSAYPFWVAKYSSAAPTVVKNYAAWQYTSTASVSGVTGKVDRSYFYTDFANGQYNTPTEEHNMDTLRKGDKGQQVRVLQKLLGNVMVDGDFGAATKAAVEVYQKKNKLIVDGIVGQKTWEALLM